MAKEHIILTCDGGGIRGLASAVVLAELETRLKKKDPNELKFYEHFHLLAGTSAGSINVCGISSGMSPSKVRDLFLNQGINIFPEALVNVGAWISAVRWGYSQPIYKDDYGDDHKGINKVLQNVEEGVLEKPFGETMVKPTLVASYDMRNQQFIVFNNTVDAHKDIETWEVVRASSAAPVAFPAHLLSNSTFIKEYKKQGYKVINDNGKECIPLVDGGLAANNPAMYAITYALSQGIKLEDLVVASIGTGRDPTPDQNDLKTALQLSREDAEEWGVLEWISPLREVPILRSLFDGSADATDHQVQQLLEPEKSYFRFQPEFTSSFQSYNANRDQLEKMIKETEEFLKRDDVSKLMDRLVNRILGLNSDEE